MSTLARCASSSQWRGQHEYRHSRKPPSTPEKGRLGPEAQKAAAISNLLKHPGSPNPQQNEANATPENTQTHAKDMEKALAMARRQWRVFVMSKYDALCSRDQIGQRPKIELETMLVDAMTEHTVLEDLHRLLRGTFQRTFDRLDFAEMVDQWLHQHNEINEEQHTEESANAAAPSPARSPAPAKPREMKDARSPQQNNQRPVLMALFETAADRADSCAQGDLKWELMNCAESNTDMDLWPFFSHVQQLAQKRVAHKEYEHMVESFLRGANNDKWTMSAEIDWEDEALHAEEQAHADEEQRELMFQLDSREATLFLDDLFSQVQIPKTTRANKSDLRKKLLEGATKRTGLPCTRSLFQVLQGMEVKDKQKELEQSDFHVLVDRFLEKVDRRVLRSESEVREEKLLSEVNLRRVQTKTAQTSSKSPARAQPTMDWFSRSPM